MDAGLGRPISLGDAGPSPLLEPPCAPVGSGTAEDRAASEMGRKAAVWVRLRAAASGKDTLAVIDQAVVSGTSFLTTVFIGRWCGASELGVYSLGFTLLVMWGCVQESLIAIPYTIYRHRPLQETEVEYAGSALVHQALLSVLVLVVLAAGGAVLSLMGALPELTDVTWVLAGVMPFALLREFGRRFAFAHLRMAEALVLDLAVAAVQLAGLAGLAAVGALSAATAYAAVGAACALSAAVWLYLARRHFLIRWRQVRPRMRQSWALGKWLFASQLTLAVQGYFIHWLLAWEVGTTATGVYAACMTVVLFSNPLILGISNALAPRTAQAFSQGGGAELRRVVLQTTLLLGLAMALFCGVVFLTGDEVMDLLYDGPQYDGHGHTVAVLALAMLATALGMPASNALTAIERPDAIFKVGLVAVALTAVLVPCLVAGWDVRGAAYGFLAGNMAGAAGRWLAFEALVLRRARGKERARAWSEAEPAPTLADARSGRVLQVLQQFSAGSDEAGWLIRPINEGAQASIFAIRRQDDRPVWAIHREVAVKLYKPTAPQYRDVVRDQFQSLSRLHARLHDRTIQGWQIHAPQPLYQCERPFALVMTVVPGNSLNACLEAADELTTEALDTIAQTVVAAMEPCWSIHAQIHGDLNFDNILCDLAGQSLSFVDPGVLEDGFLCEGVSKHWYPASRDLAYLLYDTGVTVRRYLGNRGVRQKQQRLIESILCAFMKRIGSAAEQLLLLDEIQACVQVHLERLHVSWSPRGLWHVFLRRIAFRRIDGILARLRAGAAGAGPVGHPNGNGQS
jgi:O-antigen/teichoic acid export membrane protein/serine/threonine-protein kinase RIO1